jgi:hypothetical protein
MPSHEAPVCSMLLGLWPCFLDWKRIGSYSILSFFGFLCGPVHAKVPAQEPTMMRRLADGVVLGIFTFVYNLAVIVLKRRKRVPA